jgi:Calx-beta domain-containing protein
MLGVDVKLTNPTNKDVTFTYDTSNSSAHENDYGVVTNGIVVIPAGATSTRVFITILSDTRTEGDENLFVTIKDPVNANLSNATCEVTIKDDDQPTTGAAYQRFLFPVTSARVKRSVHTVPSALHAEKSRVR